MSEESMSDETFFILRALEEHIEPSSKKIIP